MSIYKNKIEKWRFRDVLFSYIIIYILTVVVALFVVLNKLDLQLNEIQEYILNKTVKHVIFLLAIWFLIRRYSIISIKDLLFFNRNSISPFIIGVVGCGIFFVIGFLNIPLEIESSMLLSKNYKGIYIIIFLINLLLFVPVIEELYFRGLVFNILKNRFDLFWGIAITTVLFSLGHPRSWLNAGILSIIYTLVYEKTNCLLFAILTHSICNGMAIVYSLIIFYYF